MLECDNFLKNACYHSGCMAKYLLVKSSVHDTEDSVHEVAFKSLISVINDELFEHKKALFMSHILNTYKSFLPKDVSDSYPSAKLQTKLVNFYGSSITIQPQRGQGMSSICIKE